MCRSTPSCVVCAPIAAGEDRFGTSGAFGGRTGPVRLGMIRLGADFEEADAVKFPSLESAFSFTFGCLCRRCVVSEEEVEGGGRALEHDLETLREARYGRDSDLTPHSIIVLPVSLAALHLVCLHLCLERFRE